MEENKESINKEPELPTVNFVTKIEFLKEKYYFHEQIGERKKTNHYIVEDLEVDVDMDPSMQDHLFYYLKQIFPKSKKELEDIKSYYIKLIKYCQAPFAKNDIIKYCDVLDFVDLNKKYFEIVVICDFGESERIDIKNIEKDHINKFLKNVCLLLKDLKKFDNIYHSNIFLKNIVLDNDELKLSGFKPLILESDNEKDWKIDFINKYGVHRLDLFLLGLLWLKFLNRNIDDKIGRDLKLNTVLEDIEKEIKNLTKEQQSETISHLLDLKNYKDIDLDLVILNFDEYYILENIKIEENGKTKEIVAEKKDNNLFTKSLESDVFEGNNIIEPKTNNLEANKNEFLIKIDGVNFTLQDENSVGIKEDRNLDEFDIETKKKIRERMSLDPNVKEKDFKNTVVESFGNFKRNSHKITLEIKTTKTAKNKELYNSEYVDQNKILKKDNGTKKIVKKTVKRKEKILKNEKKNIKKEVLKKINERLTNSKKNLSRKEKNDILNLSLNNKTKKIDYNFTKKITPKDFMDITTLKQQRIEEDEEINNKGDEKEKYVFGKLVKKDKKPNLELEKMIKEEIQRKKDEIEKKLKQDRELLKKKDEERKKKEEDLKKKIQRALKKKKKKKIERIPEKEINRQEIKKKYGLELLKKKRSKSPLEEKKIKINKLKNLSHYQDRVDMFEYNTRDYKNKNIPFKKVFDKYKAQYHNKKIINKSQRRNDNLFEEEDENNFNHKVQRKINEDIFINKDRNFTNLNYNIQSNTSTVNNEFQGNENHNLENNDNSNLKNDYMSFKKNEIFKGNKNFDNIEDNLKKIHRVENINNQENSKKEKEPEVYAYNHEDGKSQEIQNIEKNNTIEEIKNKDENEKLRQIYEVENKNDNNDDEKLRKIYGVDNNNENNVEDDDDKLRKIYGVDNTKENNVDDDHKLREIYGVKNTYNPNEDNENLRKIYGVNDNNGYNQQENKNNDFNQENIRESQNIEKIKQKSFNENLENKDILDNFDETHFGLKDNKKNIVIEAEEIIDNFQSLNKNPQKICESIKFKKFGDHKVKEKLTKKIAESEKCLELENVETSEKEIKTKILQNKSICFKKIDEKVKNITSNQKNKSLNSTEIDINSAEDLLKPQNFTESVILLNSLLPQAKKNQKFEIFKTLSMLYYRNKNYTKSSNEIRNAIKILNFENDNKNTSENDSKRKNLKLSLSINYIEENDYKKALNILNEITDEYPKSYWTIKGDCYRNIESFEEAFKCYINEFDIIRNSKNIDQENINSLHLLLNKIIFCLGKIEGSELVKFFNFAFEAIENMSQRIEDKKLFDGFEENMIIDLLNILFIQKNYDLLNYFLNLCISEELIEIDFLTDEKIFLLSKIYFQFALYLKSIPNYGNQKESFINFFNYCIFLIDSCKVKNSYLEEKIKILLYKGIFFIQQNVFSSAYEYLKESYDMTLITSPKNPKRLDFLVLYNLALSLYNLKNYEDSLYYYEKILELGCNDDIILDKTMKSLAKIYYRLGLYDRCVKNLKNWIFEDLKNKKFKIDFKYLTIYYLCSYKTNSENFDEVLEVIKFQLKNNKDIESKFYLNLFHNLSLVHFEKKNFDENEKYLTLLQNLVNININENYADKFLNMINLMYTKYIMKKNEEAINLNSQLLKSLKDKNLNLEKNASNIENFLYDFLFLLLNKLPQENPKFNFEFRNNLLDQIKLFKEENKINDKIYEIINSNRSISKEVINTKNNLPKLNSNKILENQNKLHNDLIISKKIKANNAEKPKETEIIEEDKKIKKFRKFGKIKRINSTIIVENSNYDKKTKCLCYQLNFKKFGILKPINQFFAQIKNMIYLEVTQDIEKYYNEFESIIKKKNFNWEKFIYVKKLFKFFLTNKNTDKKKIVKLLNSIIENKDLCIHDIKNMLMLLESFQQPIYIEVFINYLHKYHKNLSGMIFNKLFLEEFEKQFEEINFGLYRKILDKKFFFIDNNPFIHYLNASNILKIEKNLIFKFYQRFRYEYLNKIEYFQIFSNYINEKKLHKFYLKYAIFTSNVDLIRKRFSNEEILNKLIDRLIEILREGKIEKINDKYFIYNIYLVSHLINFEENAVLLADKILQILFILQKKMINENYYHFAVVSSLIGNIFFKKKLFENSIKTKSLAFEMIKVLNTAEMNFPSFFKKILPKQLMNGILSFMLVNQLNLNNPNSAEKFLEKLISFPAKNENEKIDKKLFEIVYSLQVGHLKRLNECLNDLNSLLVHNNSLENIKADFYYAVYENIKYQFMMNKGDVEEVIIQNQRRKSRKSVDKLYHNLISQ